MNFYRKVILNRKIHAILLLCIITIGIIYFVSYEKIVYTDISIRVDSIDSNIGEIVEGDVIEQYFYPQSDFLNEISINVATYARNNTGNLIIRLLDHKSDILKNWVIEIESLADNSFLSLNCDRLPVNGNDLFLLQIETEGCSYGNAITVYSSNVTNVLHGTLMRNGVQQKGELNISLGGYTYSHSETRFFIISAIVVFLIFIIMALNTLSQNGILKNISQSMLKYKFLIKQLVSRDFKTKYKRSALGFLWSFLNPLLTMAVQYVVFSTIFKSDIKNFPVYLLSAGIVFNFFTESVGAGLTAIVGNTALITKVHVPKYIYPLTRVLSTAINLLISLVPLMVVVFATGEKLSKAYLVIPFMLFCLVAFCIGMALLLSTCMVYFRDTQFLWGIISLIWMYATPIFYPESIIPDKFSIIFRINPMYHFLKFFRTILIGGNAPELYEYVYCLAFSLIFLCIGSYVFSRHQSKFVLYL